VSVAVNFDPTEVGQATGNLVVTSNAPQVQIPLTGTGIAGAGPQYSVAVNWSPSTSTVVGYYVYRGTGTNPQLSKLGGILASTSYQDLTVLDGQTYTYAVTSVDSSGDESALSTSVSVTIPSQ
jgi:fibronectin type 3 domain-containing protein